MHVVGFWKFGGMTHGKLTTPKSGESRRVDMSRELLHTLETLPLNRQLEETSEKEKKVNRGCFVKVG